MQIKPFADQGNYTAVHNAVFDVLMPSLPPNAFKVLCFIIRKTVGWRRESDTLSYSQLMDGTGIVSSATLRTAIKILAERQIIIVTDGEGQWTAASYQLNTQLIIDAPASKIEAVSTTEIEVEPASKIEVGTSKIEVDTTLKIEAVSTSKIEDTKEKKEIKTPPPPTPVPTPSQDRKLAAMAAAIRAGISERHRIEISGTKAREMAMLVAEELTDIPTVISSFAGLSSSDTKHIGRRISDILAAPPPVGRPYQPERTASPAPKPSAPPPPLSAEARRRIVQAALVEQTKP